MAELRRASVWGFAGLILLSLTGCQEAAPPPAPARVPDTTATPQPVPQPEAPSGDPIPSDEAPSKPKPPLALQPPSPPPKIYQGKDLTTIDGSELAGLALRMSKEKRHAESVQLQYWATVADDDGRYNLACFQALAGDKDAAFYSLQEAAIKDGVDAEWAGQDSDLESLRRDPRWRQIQPYLDACGAYWAASGHRVTVLTLPEGYKVGTPIGVLVWMHGRGASPGGLPDELQGAANELKMAVVGVSGTIPRGLSAFVWSEDPARDADQVRKALKEVADRLTVDPGQIVPFGFSQGAQMAFEMAFRYPDEFRGAIVMSPGTSKDVDLSGLIPGPKNRGQGFVYLCGAQELPGNVAITRQDYDFAKKAGSRTELKLQEGQNQHAFPPDFSEKFTGWVRFVLGETKGKASP